ncbi:MAG: hypothetical protein ACLQBL_39250 [Polyangiaceae bacterium]
MKRLACALVLVACGGSTPPPSAPAESQSSPDATAPPPDVVDAAPPTSTPTSTSTPTPTSTPTSTPTPTATSDAGPSFDMSVVFGVYKEHKDALRAACWDHSKSTEKAYLGKASIRLGPTGKLVSVKTEGTDDIASACVDKQIKKWKFPPPNGTATIVLPIHMHRD